MLRTTRSGGDAFGKALSAFQAGRTDVVHVIVRVEDGHEEEEQAGFYFRTHDQWSPIEHALLAWVNGRVLDVGVGAGRISLYLQERGHEVVGIDVSPGAVEVSRQRGVRDVRLHSVLEAPLNSRFDSILLFGMNLGIAGLHDNVGPFLERLKGMLNPDGRIVGTQINWERTGKPEHLAFQEMRRSSGHHPVEFTLAITFEDEEERFSWCLTNQEELREVAGEVGLGVEAIIDCGEIYGYVLKAPED